jgi:hypothetical protein
MAAPGAASVITCLAEGESAERTFVDALKRFKIELIGPSLEINNETAFIC